MIPFQQCHHLCLSKLKTHLSRDIYQLNCDIDKWVETCLYIRLKTVGYSTLDVAVYRVDTQRRAQRNQLI